MVQCLKDMPIEEFSRAHGLFQLTLGGNREMLYCGATPCAQVAGDKIVLNDTPTKLAKKLANSVPLLQGGQRQ